MLTPSSHPLLGQGHRSFGAFPSASQSRQNERLREIETTDGYNDTDWNTELSTLFP